MGVYIYWLGRKRVLDEEQCKLLRYFIAPETTHRCVSFVRVNGPGLWHGLSLVFDILLRDYRTANCSSSMTTPFPQSPAS